MTVFFVDVEKIRYLAAVLLAEQVSLHGLGCKIQDAKVMIERLIVLHEIRRRQSATYIARQTAASTVSTAGCAAMTPFKPQK